MSSVIQQTASCSALLHALMQLPPNFDTAEQILSKDVFDADTVTSVGLHFAEACFEESINGPIQPTLLPSGALAPEFHSQFLYAVTDLLLRFGLDPNVIQDGENMMFAICHVTHGLVAADTLALLLEHGGNANLSVEEESLLSNIEFDITFELFNPCPSINLAALIHLWMVLVGYGAKYPEGRKNLNQKVFLDFWTNMPFDVTNLKQHRMYFFGVSNQEESYLVHLYDHTTFREVLQF